MSTATATTSKEIVHSMLRPRHWVSGSDIEAEAGPGSLRRVRELRSDGFEIKKRRIEGSHSYEYRLVGRS